GPRGLSQGSGSFVIASHRAVLRADPLAPRNDEGEVFESDLLRVPATVGAIEHANPCARTGMMAGPRIGCEGVQRAAVRPPRRLAHASGMNAMRARSDSGH